MENNTCCRDFRGKKKKKEDVEENQSTRRKPLLRYCNFLSPILRSTCVKPLRTIVWSLMFSFCFSKGNALREWSFRKAITLQTYSDYHPIPVPFNIGFWCWWLFCSRCCKGCIRDFRGCKGDSFSEKKVHYFTTCLSKLPPL